LKILVEENKPINAEKEYVQVQVPDIPVLSLTPRDAFYAETETIAFENSVGRVIAEFVMVYPPGIPIFIPGEIITEDNIKYISTNIKAGLPVQGPEDESFKMIKVIKEHIAIR
jgi:arginine decarboxylase